VNDNKHKREATAPASLEEVLAVMNEAGKFTASLLTSPEGLPIAAAPADYDSDVAAAMVALLQRVSHDAQGQLGMAEVDEVTIRDHDTVCLVCRCLTVGQQRLILTVTVPPGRPYRRVTNQAIRQIKHVLS
jgi:predicted regulator of Ras-like GTPase activity (Roadblock/LC7/MglB family)